jgi:hypothetical protein
MSAGLTSGYSRHDFRDDLESSIYVLLWTTLMYSAVPEKNVVVSTLRHVLDPHPYGNNGGFGKMDLLRGRTFFSQVKLLDWPKLHELMFHLSKLFAVRYEDPPTNKQRETETFVRSFDAPDLLSECYAAQYDMRLSQLKTHEFTIELFQDALEDRSQWPPNDAAVLQQFDNHSPPPQPVIKTGWCSSQFG